MPSRGRSVSSQGTFSFRSEMLLHEELMRTFLNQQALTIVWTVLGMKCVNLLRSRPVPKLGPFEIDHKSAA